MAIACAVAATPGTSAAQARVPRIAVGTFTGERAAVTRSMVASVLANHVGEIELASQGEYAAAASRAGVSEATSEEAIVAVSRDLHLDEVVIGNLERRGTTYRLLLRVLRGRDGHSAGSASWEFDRMEELNALSAEIWEQLRGSFQADPAQSPARSDAPPDAPPPDATTNQGAPSTAPQGPAAAPTPGLGWLWIHLAGGLSGRQWRIPLLGETSPRGYENGAFGELRGTLATYYRLNNNRLGVGLEGTIGVPLGLASQGKGADGRVVPIATSALELSFGASLAMRPLNGGLMRAFVGMIYQQFSIDTSRLSPEMRLAPTTYVGLRIAGEGTLPIYARRDWEFGVVFGGEVRLVAVGSEMKDAFGVNPGTTLGYGSWFGLSARLDRVAPGLGVRATAEFVRYATDFAGPARVGTPGESVDDYSRFMFGVTYAVGTDRSSSRRSAASSFLGTPATATPEPEAGAPSGAQTPAQTGGDPFGAR